MKTLLLKVVPLVCLIFVISNCEKDYMASEPPVDLATPVSFKGDIMPIFKATCFGAGCHDKGIAPDLTEANAYDQLLQLGYVDTLDAEKCKLYLRMISTAKPMPPSGKLAAEKTNLILAWIKQGAHNN